MDFDRERELEDAGIDAFEFSLMDEAERRAVLSGTFPSSMLSVFSPISLMPDVPVHIGLC